MELLTLAVMVFFVAVFVSMLGLGGGFVYVPLFYWLGIDIFIAIPTALLLNTVTSSSAAITYLRKRMVDLQLDSIHTIRDVDEDTPLNAEEAEIIEAAAGRILMFHLGGPMSFGAAKGMARQLDEYDDYDVLILELSDVPQIDFTATRALYDMVYDAQSVKRQVYLVGCHEQVCDMMKKQGVVDQLPKENLVKTRIDALRSARKSLK